MNDTQFDVIVIGAGIAGASVAAHLANDVRVALLERESQPGYHSTGRSAALFSESYGNSVVRALSRASRDFFYQPPNNFAEHPLTTPRGALHIAREDQLQALDAFLAETDVAATVHRVDHREVEDRCPVLRQGYAAGGALEPNARDVDVHALHQGFLRELKRAGATLLVDANCTSLSKSGANWRVVTTHGIVEAPIVVNAAGAWADETASLAGVAPLGITPCRRTAVLVDAPPGLEHMPLVIDIDETFYFKPDAGKLLLSPADETPSSACDAQPDELDVAIAVDRVENATTLKIARVWRKWAGLRSFAPDRSPVIGFDVAATGFFWLAGQGGYGIQTAPAAARLAAALILGEGVPEDIARYGVTAEMVSPQRFASQRPQGELRTTVKDGRAAPR